MTIWGSIFAKANAVYNPIVYGISHPKYREALAKKYPRWFGGASSGKNADDKSVATTTESAGGDSVNDD